MADSIEDTLAQVPTKAMQVREPPAHWAWVERSVWTDRMLTALERGVKGNVWFSLIDKVTSKANLLAATQSVVSKKGSGGVDHVTTKQFSKNASLEIDRLHDELTRGSYRPQAVRRVMIEKLGTKELRPLGIPTVRDRVVQTALRNVLEPIFEQTFAKQSYGFRPQRGCKDALRRVDELLNSNYTWIVEIDFKSYFDTIPHERLMALVRQQVADGRVLSLIESFLRQKIMDGLAEWTPDGGTPQGAVISPLLANIYLNPLDHAMVKMGHEMVRYADDAVVLCRSEIEAKQAMAALQEWATEVGLTLHPAKTCMVDLSQYGNGFDFLGYRFQRAGRGIRHWPRKKSVSKLRAAIRPITKRTSGDSLKEVIRRINTILRGWFGYFKHSNHTIFVEIDGWSRMRLRSMLRKRTKRKGRGNRMSDSQRWPNRFFQEHGLFSLAEAHDFLRRSSTR